MKQVQGNSVDRLEVLHRTLSKYLTNMNSAYIPTMNMVEIYGNAATRVITKEFELEISLASERLYKMEQALSFALAELALYDENSTDWNEIQADVLQLRFDIDNLSTQLSRLFQRLMYSKEGNNGY